MKMRLLLTTIFLFAGVFGVTTSCRDSANSTNKNVSPNSNIMPVSSPKTTTSSVPVYGYEVVNTFKHDPKAFTEGLFFHNGFLYESTGEQGRSSLRKVDLESGEVKQKQNLTPEIFGEGISLINGKIYQLSWQNYICFVYDAETFKPIKQFIYEGEGWGMTTDGTSLIMSNGSHQIQFIDPETFKTTRKINVFREDGLPMIQLNELEWIKGEIWANIWHSDDKEILGKPNHIARIDPQTGKLLGYINLDGISDEDVKRDPENTLNGIAYDEKADRIFVTGKNWKKLFEIKLKNPVS